MLRARDKVFLLDACGVAQKTGQDLRLQKRSLERFRGRVPQNQLVLPSDLYQGRFQDMRHPRRGLAPIQPVQGARSMHQVPLYLPQGPHRVCDQNKRVPAPSRKNAHVNSFRDYKASVPDNIHQKNRHRSLPPTKRPQYFPWIPKSPRLTKPRFF